MHSDHSSCLVTFKMSQAFTQVHGGDPMVDSFVGTGTTMGLCPMRCEKADNCRSDPLFPCAKEVHTHTHTPALPCHETAPGFHESSGRSSPGHCDPAPERPSRDALHQLCTAPVTEGRPCSAQSWTRRPSLLHNSPQSIGRSGLASSRLMTPA